MALRREQDTALHQHPAISSDLTSEQELIGTNPRSHILAGQICQQRRKNSGLRACMVHSRTWGSCRPHAPMAVLAVTHTEQPCLLPCAGRAPSSLLFDWALPVLRASSQPNEQDWHSQYWVLVALQECLACVDDVTRSRYAHIVLQAVQSLLESDATSVHLLIPILGVLLQVKPCSTCIFLSQLLPFNQAGDSLWQSFMPSIPVDARQHLCTLCAILVLHALS